MTEPASAPSELAPGSAPRPGAWTEAPRLSGSELFDRIVGLPARLWRHRDLVVTSVLRDVKSRVSGTFLGHLWPLVHPALLFAVYYVLFTKLFGFRLPDLPEQLSGALGVYIFLGVIVWTAVAESWSRCTSAIVDNANLIQKVAFPAEILPLNIVLAQLWPMLLGLALFWVLTLLTPLWPVSFGAHLLWIPVLLVLQVVFASGLGYLLAASHVFVRDTQHVVAAFTTVWMLATPVFWPPLAEVLPPLERWMPLVQWNPMHHLLHAWRGVLMSAEPEVLFAQSIARSALLFGLFAAVAWVVGAAVFLATRPRFADEV